MAMWTSTKRILKSGFIGFWRNTVVSLASILIMVVTLSVLATLVFGSAMLNTALLELKDKVDINVYLLPDTQEEDAFALKDQLDSLPEVASVEYVSREEALERFRLRHENDQLTLQALDELGDNPLGATLNIKAGETSQYETIAKFLESDAALGVNQSAIIDTVNFNQNRVAIERLSKIIDSAGTLGFALATLLIVLSIVITFNTIRLAIYTAREEISVMRLVGASNTYVRGPFVIEGVLYGLVAAFFTLLIFYPIAYWLGPYTESFFGNINMLTYYVENFGQLFLILVGAGMVLGAVSSFLAVRRYLKV
jgi:cell division transport system permease protein